MTEKMTLLLLATSWKIGLWTMKSSLLLSNEHDKYVPKMAECHFGIFTAKIQYNNMDSMCNLLSLLEYKRLGNQYSHVSLIL